MASRRIIYLGDLFGYKRMVLVEESHRSENYMTLRFVTRGLLRIGLRSADASIRWGLCGAN